MDLGALLLPGGVVLDVTAKSKRQALSRVADAFARASSLPSREVMERLLERETLGSTGLGGGLGVPHARIAGLTGVKAVFVRLETPLAFQAIDDRPVDLLFGLVAPEEDGGAALRALAAVSRAVRSSAVRERLRQARSEDAVRAIFLPETPAAAA